MVVCDTNIYYVFLGNNNPGEPHRKRMKGALGSVAGECLVCFSCWFISWLAFSHIPFPPF